EGDLPESASGAVTRHVRECRACSDFLVELRESQSVFKSIRQEFASPAALANVRERVLDRVGRTGARSSWFGLERWGFSGFRRYRLVGVAVAVLVTGALWRQRPAFRPEAPAIQPIAAVQPPLATDVTGPVASPKEHPARRPPRRLKHPAKQLQNAAAEPRQIV